MAEKRAWKGSPNGQEPNLHKEFDGIHSAGELPSSQVDSVGAGDLPMRISAKHNKKLPEKRPPSEMGGAEYK